jgi:hypothetical protein
MVERGLLPTLSYIEMGRRESAGSTDRTDIAAVHSTGCRCPSRSWGGVADTRLLGLLCGRGMVPPMAALASTSLLA